MFEQSELKSDFPLTKAERAEIAKMCEGNRCALRLIFSDKEEIIQVLCSGFLLEIKNLFKKNEDLEVVEIYFGEDGYLCGKRYPNSL